MLRSLKASFTRVLSCYHKRENTTEQTNEDEDSRVRLPWR